MKKYSGVLIVVGWFMLVLTLAAFFSIFLLMNNGSLVFNITSLLFISVCFYLFAMPYYKVRPELVTFAYCIITFGVIHFLASVLENLASITRNPAGFPEDNFSGLITVPILFILALLWGWLFDIRKNKIIANK